MNKFVIICGGKCKTDGVPPSVFENAYIIAADSGYDTAKKLNVTPQLLVGDMDSISSVPCGIDTYRVKAEKDDTDTMLAISIARSRGADEIILVGGGGGRLDHLLSNIFMLEALADEGIRHRMYDGTNEAFVLSDGEVTLKKRGGYFGIIALEDSVVTATGCKYPLNAAPLKRTLPYAVSNEVTGSEAMIKVRGKVVVIVSK
ncbi:MAG: thiamine diphosphokinase [Clostridia bacterium]|nr:thiamine diphosphokinase [Clostridia bacterium]